MKKLLLFIFLLVFWANIKGQNYIPFPTLNTVWSEHFKAPVSTSLTSYYYRNILADKDTTIGAKTYHQLFYSHSDTVYSENSSALYNGGIRENNRQVFYLPKDSVSEYLLYDFSLQVGDTLAYNYSKFASGYHLYPYDTLFVTSIDSVLIENGTYHKRIGFSARFGNNIEPVSWASWIEGIGYEMGLLIPIGDIPTNGQKYTLGCLKQNNEILYYNDLFINCYPVNESVFEFSKQNEIIISPNPVQDYCKIQWEVNNVQFDRILIYDVYGRIVFSKKIDQNNDIIIDCRNFGQGMYLVNIVDRIGSQLTSKLLIL
jgi:hypothetical protein